MITNSIDFNNSENRNNLSDFTEFQKVNSDDFKN